MIDMKGDRINLKGQLKRLPPATPAPDEDGQSPDAQGQAGRSGDDPSTGEDTAAEGS